MQEAVDLAVRKRQDRLRAEGREAGTRGQNLPYVVHVHSDRRRVYVGDEFDVTANGKSIMTHNKAWKSLPIRSWTGGVKVRTSWRT